MTEYYSAINKLAEDKSEVVFSNKGVEHASIVMSTIFDRAESYVYIYAVDMKGSISNRANYLLSMDNLVKRFIDVRVILDKKPENMDEAFALCKLLTLRNEKFRVKLKLATQSFRDKLLTLQEKNDEIYHFAISDDRMIRVEVDNENHLAPFCSFNQPEIVKILHNFIDTEINGLPDIE